MTLIGLILLIALAAAGALALALGLRGRRINDHPHCRRCRFDLSGIDASAESAKCPECGAALDQPKSIRIGACRRRPGFIGIGAASLLIAIAIGVAAGWSTATGFNWNTKKPEWLLEYEATHRDQPVGATAELIHRAAAGTLSAERHGRLARWFAEEFESVSSSVTGHLGDLFGHAWTRGLVDEETLREYWRNATSLQFGVLENPSELGAVFLYNQHSARWAGSIPSLPSAFAEIAAIHIGDVSLKRMPFRILDPSKVIDDQPWWIIMRPGWNKNGFGAHVAVWSPMSLNATDRLQSGPQEIHIDLKWTLHAGAPAPWPFDLDDGNPRRTTLQWIERRTIPVQILEESEVEPEAVLDDSLAEEMRKNLRVRQLTVEKKSIGYIVRLLVEGEGAPVPISGDVLLRAGERTWTLDDPFTMNLRHPFGSVNDVLEDFDVEMVDIIIRPNPVHTRLLDGLRKYWGGDLVFRDVPVEAGTGGGIIWSQNSPQQRPEK